MQTRKNIQARLKAITLALLLGSLQLVHAAIDPVTAIVSLAPPYTPFINEYATTGTNKLQVTLIVNDSRLVNHPARLQMVIERADGSGAIMATNEYAAIAPILLTGQATEILTGADLAPYFMAQNNMFTGFSQSQYVQTGRIPDGQYRIGFRVVDAQRANVVLSNVAYTQPGWFVLNDPPLLNLPRNKEGQRVNEPQYLKLEWFPRHLGSMNSAFAASYKVELFAIRVPGMDPQQVAMSMQPDYSEETTRTNLYLTPDKYLLEPGVEYAWRVKAFSDNGLALFQNNGHSEVYSFVYGDLCPTPENVEAEVLGPEKAVISWGTDPAHTSYEARFRAKGKENARWHTRQTFQDNVALNSLLSPGMSYEYQVKAKSPTAESGYSPLATFTTPEINKGEKFECGSEDNVKVDNQNPKEHLKIGDMIYNGGFPVKLTEVSGSNGVFTGKGRVRIPFLANVQVNMEFKNIRVNELDQVYKGKLVSVYNPKSKFYIDDITDYWSVGDQVGNIVTGREAAQIELGHTVSNASDIKVTYNDNTNMVTVTSTSGGGTVTEHVTSTTGGTTISDAEGNLYAVDEGGNVAKAGKSGGNEGTESYGTTAAKLNQLDKGQVVTFFNAGGDKWAFDEWQPAYNGKALIEKEYENISGYRVPWKLVPAGKPGKVYAEVTKGDIDISKVTFKTPAGTVYEARKKGRGVELAVIGSEHGDGQEIYALYQQGDTMTKSLGKLKVASYNMVARKLFIVPVNQLNVNVDEIEKGVNEIFLPYGVEWDVKLTSPFLNKTWDLNGDGMLDAGESGMFSMYTPEMKALNRAYETSHETDEEAIYVFVLTKSTGTTGLLLGDMPISSKFGYLFSPKGKDITSKTVAHEIAHGMFQLKHTFDEDYALEKSKTDNLMDYAGGTSLFKQQWDAMYDQQALLFAWLQDEGEGAYKDQTGLLLKRVYHDILVKYELFSLADIWDDKSLVELFKKIKPHLTNTFFVKDDDEKFIIDKERYYKFIGLNDESEFTKEVYDNLSNEQITEYELALTLTGKLNEIFYSFDTYESSKIDNIKHKLYRERKKEVGDEIFKYTWIDGSVHDYMDPRTYYKNGEYLDKKLKQDIKELILLMNPDWITDLSEEMNLTREQRYYTLKAMFSEYMYTEGVYEIPSITSSKASELAEKIRLDYVEEAASQNDVLWTLITIEEEKAEQIRLDLEKRLAEEAALKAYLEKQKGKAVRAMVVGGTGVVTGVIIMVCFPPSAPGVIAGISTAITAADIGFSLSTFIEGASMYIAINNDIFDKNKEYNIFKGIVVEMFGDGSAKYYDFASIVVGIASVTDNVTTIYDLPKISGKELEIIIRGVNTGATSVSSVETGRTYFLKKK